MFKALQASIRSSEKLAEASDWAARVWKYGLAASDVFGRIVAGAKKFKAEAMPMLDRTEAQVEAGLEELAQIGLVHPYESEGRRYIVFHKHEDYNKSHKNLKNLRPTYPPPPPICPCVQYADSEIPSPAPPPGIEQEHERNVRGTPVVPPTVPPTGSLPASHADISPLELCLRPREVGDDPRTATEAHLLMTAVRVAKCPSNEGTIRKHVRALCVRADVGPIKLETYLSSPEARGLTVNDWVDHFRHNGKPILKGPF